MWEIWSLTLNFCRCCCFIRGQGQIAKLCVEQETAWSLCQKLTTRLTMGVSAIRLTNLECFVFDPWTKFGLDVYRFKWGNLILFFLWLIALCMFYCVVLYFQVMYWSIFEVFRRKMISQYVGVDLVKRISTCTYSFMIMQDIWRCTWL